MPGAGREPGSLPTMSPSTTPASIEVSCPGSPTRISRASGRTASTSRAISDSDTIEVSSTITTSCGRRLPRSCANRLWLPGRHPSSRCSVDARRPIRQLPHRVADRQPRGLLVDGLLKSGRGLAGRRGQRDQRRPGWVGSRCSGLLDQLRDDPSDSRRLPGAGAAGDHLQPAARGQLVQVGGDRALLAPVAVEVEPRAEQPQRLRASHTASPPARSRGFAPAGSTSSSPTATSSLPASARKPLVDSRPWQRRQVDRLVRLDASRCRGSWPGRRTRGRAAGRGRPAQPRASPTRSPRRPAPPSRAATCTSAADSTPMSLNSRSSPVAPAARRASNGSEAIALTPPLPSRTSLSAADEVSGRLPREHARLGPTQLPRPPSPAMPRTNR